MRRRVLVSILLAVAATALALGVPLGVLAWNSVADRAQAALLTRLDAVAGYLEQNARTPVLDQRELQVALVGGGRLTVRRPGLPDTVVGEDIVGDAFVQTDDSISGVSVALAIPQRDVRAPQWQEMLLVVSAVAASLLVGTTIALVLARRLAAPLGHAAERAARLGAGDFRVVPQRYRVAELDRMLDVLDAAAQDIAALVGRERELAVDISHQLRTRLAGLRLSLEEADLAGEGDPLLADALSRTDELVAVVDEILAAARTRRAAGSRLLDLSAELAQLQERWRRAFAAVGRTITAECEPGTVVYATPVRLREALSGLLDNALRHGAGPVSVRARPDRRTVVIEVSDQGPGIPEALVGHVFDRGVSTASSTGIGLGLARAFVEADGGRLELRRSAPPVFGIFLPAAAP